MANLSSEELYQEIFKLDDANMKALAVAEHLSNEAGNGTIHKINVISLIDIIIDYLKANNKIFNKIM